MGTTSLVAIVIGVVATGFIVDRIAEKNYAPQEAYAPAVTDLNRDKIPDLIIKRQNGHKIPMYGVRHGENIKYISASKMMRQDPDSIIDYATIESRLNKK